jgi:hypothetical protein
VVGVAGAVWMDRGPQRAPWIAGAALASWLMLMVRQRLVQRSTSESAAGVGTVLQLARFSTLLATQSLIHLSVYFALPFYFAALALDPGHLAFAALLVAMAVLSLWDPWSEWLLSRPVLGLMYPALASFVALNAVLPGLGLSNRQALWVAAALASAPIPLASFGNSARGGARAPLGRALLVALVLPAFLAVGGARLIPAAPMRLMRIAFGTEVVDRWVSAPIERLSGSPDSLVCATAIFAPLGVREELLHVWALDGAVKHRIKLAIRGGRAAGFRTYSRIRRPRDHARWECRVVTGSGQLLGAARLVIE